MVSSLISLRQIAISSIDLQFIDGRLSLVWPDHRIKPLCVDFLSGSVRHRREFGGGRGQLIAKAIGLKKYPNPTVLDLSAGFGQDGFVLACLGCQVTLIERCNPMWALLNDGLERLYQAEPDKRSQLQLVHTDAVTYLNTLESTVDMIYFDPMYPETGNSAISKKTMQVLRELAGDDADASEVLELARAKAKHRIVVKRPKQGELLGGLKPDFQIVGKSSRFDVYLPL